jgi:hypothetical protein
LNSDEIGEKALDYSLPTQTTAAFLSKDSNSTDTASRWDPVSPELVKRLAERSKTRVAKDQKFAEIKKEIEETVKNKGIIKLADLRKKSKKPAKDKAERDQKIKDVEQPLIDEGVNIIVDFLSEKEKNPVVAAGT